MIPPEADRAASVTSIDARLGALDALLADGDWSTSDQAAIRAEFVELCHEESTGWRVLTAGIAAYSGGESPRVLEVGAGLGLVVRRGVAAGLDITGLEPIGVGFEHLDLGLAAVGAADGPTDAAWLDTAVEDLEPAAVGRFDVIVSTYVLEHVPDVSAAMAAMSSVLSPDGVMVHLVPNYAFPYEPHFGLPVIAAAPTLTARAFRRRVAPRPQLWKSLNFATYRDYLRAAERSGLTCSVETSVMAETILRLADDPDFAHRHPRLAWAGGLLPIGRLAAGAGRIPPRWQTPMLLSFRHDRSTGVG